MTVKTVYSYEQLCPGAWDLPRLLHMYDNHGLYILDCFVTADIVLTDGRGAYYPELESNAITIIDDLQRSIFVPTTGRVFTYTVETPLTKAPFQQTGSPGMSRHSIKTSLEAPPMHLWFKGRQGRSENMLQFGDADRWVYVQDVTGPSFKSGAHFLRPGQKGSRLLGYIARIDDRDLDNPDSEVLVQPIEKTIKGLVECLGSPKGSNPIHQEG